MLGLVLPDRNLIVNGRWTGIEENMSVDTGLFQIFSIEWYGSNRQQNTVDVYLAPGFTAESTSTSSQSPWLVFGQGPAPVLGSPSGGLGLTSTEGGYEAPDNSGLPINPSGFAPVAQSLEDAETFYQNAESNLNSIVQGLAGNANQFQGEAGGAFAELMQDLAAQANYAQQTMMGAYPGGGQWYSVLVAGAATAATLFLTGIWNAWAGWTQGLTYSPLGSILQVLINMGILAGPAGNWQVPKNVNVLNVGGVNLATDAAWQTIEGQAKDIWRQNVINALDIPGRQALVTLANAYYQTADNLGPLDEPPPPTQIGGDLNGGSLNSAAPNFNFSMPNFNFSMPNFSMSMPNFNFPSLSYNTPNYSMPNYSTPNYSTAMPNYSFSYPNTAFSSSNVGGGSGANGSVGSFGSPNSYVTTYSANPNQYVSGTVTPNPYVTTYSANPNQYTSGTVIPNSYVSGTVPPYTSDLVVNPNQYTPTGTLGSGTSEQTALQDALDSNAGTQDALQSALTSGQVTPGSALYSDLNTALNDANKTQAALQQTEGAGNATNSALQSALTDNAGTQAALNQALNSGQVTSGSPLQSTLNSALNGANQTQAALNTAAASGALPSTQTSAIRTALGDNSQTQHELSTALQSGQVPASSPLHSTIQSALTDAGKTQAAINQALKSTTGTTTASLDQALKDNQATQNALNAALASGQVPATGPLRNDLNQALADAKQTGTALQQALAQQGVQTEPNLAALTSAVGVPGVASAGVAAGSTPLLSASVPAPSATTTAAQIAPVSSGAFTAPGAQTTAASSSENPFPMYSPMAGSGMMGQGQGQGQDQERERSTWLAEDEDVWGTDPEVGPQVLGRGYTDDEEPEEYDGYTDRPERPARNRPPTRRMPGR